MFEIFVDSAANIPAELVKAFKIKVLSFVNLVNGKEMTCFDPDLTPEEERQKGKIIIIWFVPVRISRPD